MELINCRPILSDCQQQKRINFLQNRLTPYFLILLFSVAMMTVRIYMVTEWRWYQHLAGFVAQTLSLIGIWTVIKWLNKVLEKKIPFSEGALQRMFIQIFLTLLIFSPLVYLFITLARPYMPSFVNKQFLAIICVLLTVIIFLFNFSFYAAHFFRNWQDSVENTARLEVQAADLARDKFNLQYHQLKNQVNPHYLFNTLTSLDGLIQTDPELASKFVRHMSKVYRYVLRHKESEVVSLEEELDFIGHYISLLHIRYGDALTVRYDLTAEAKEKGIVMVTLQMMLDNAIKHNATQVCSPLNILIRDEGDYLFISNNKQPRGQIETSNGQGINQLRQLYQFLSDKPVHVEDGPTAFTIKIPLLST